MEKKKVGNLRCSIDVFRDDQLDRITKTRGHMIRVRILCLEFSASRDRSRVKTTHPSEL